MGENKRKILLATGQQNINREIAAQKNLTVLGIVPNRESIMGQIAELNPDVVMIGEGLDGYISLPNLILDCTERFNDVRYIYLAGEVSSDDISKMESLKMLAKSGVYDLVHVGQIKKKELIELIYIPKTQEDVLYLTKEDEVIEEIVEEIVEVPVEEPETAPEPDVIIEDEIVEEIVEVIPELTEEEKEEMDRQRSKSAKVIVVSSIKPGTGKSFLSVNLAAAIANFGVLNPSGVKPKVALIEGDLQNLSLGTLLQIEDKDSNLMKTLAHMEKILTPSGEWKTEEATEIQDVNREIKKCFTPYHKLKNLEVLAGSHLRMNEVSKVREHHYAYIIEAMKSYYDVIIIDSNSSLTHTSSRPILYKANTCFFVLNLDFNNIRNNNKYQQELKNMNLMSKVKYVLNEDIQDEQVGERLSFDRSSLEEIGYKLEACIPSIPKTIFNNRLFQGVPIILGDDKETEKARKELLKVANGIYEINGYAEMNAEEAPKKKRLGFKK